MLDDRRSEFREKKTVWMLVLALALEDDRGLWCYFAVFLLHILVKMVFWFLECDYCLDFCLVLIFGGLLGIIDANFILLR